MKTKHYLWYNQGINAEFWNQIVRPTINTMVPLCRGSHKNV